MFLTAGWLLALGAWRVDAGSATQGALAIGVSVLILSYVVLGPRASRVKKTAGTSGKRTFGASATASFFTVFGFIAAGVFLLRYLISTHVVSSLSKVLLGIVIAGLFYFSAAGLVHMRRAFLDERDDGRWGWTQGRRKR